MTHNCTKIQLFRERIPAFKCTPGCHDCCGPVTASSEELSRLPVKSDAAHESALAELNCPYLGENGCEVYEERPLICRLFGTIESLPCPHQKRPDKLLNKKTEERIHAFLATTRQRLL
jgi:Fe-S-cluster containining protein